MNVMTPSRCKQCDEPLVEIDHWGERLKGCIECNTWSGGKSAFVVQLSVEDFMALRALKSKTGQQT
jgi:hypothetical protein